MKRFYAICAIRCTHFEVYNIYQILFWNSILHQNCHLFLMHHLFHLTLFSNQKCDSSCRIRKSPLFRSPVKKLARQRLVKETKAKRRSLDKAYSIHPRPRIFVFKGLRIFGTLKKLLHRISAQNAQTTFHAVNTVEMGVRGRSPPKKISKPH